MTNNEILIEIRKGFNKVQHNTAIERQRGWTQAFINVLREIGFNEKLKVYTSSLKQKIGPRKGGGEWLFDLCWSYEGFGKDDWKTHYTGLKLICECEWRMNEDEILYDFQKLAIGKAELKIMIIQYKSEEQFMKIKEACEKSVDTKLYDDNAKYILIGSGNGKNDYEIKWQELWKRN